MDASAFITLALMLASCAHFSSQMLNEEDRNNTTATTTLATPVQDTAPVTVQNCTTATGAHGSCILRRFCNYGTGAVDLTLYVPKGFIRPCKVDEACCPFEYQLPELITYNHKQTDKDFEFGDDD